jgi:hypothetical protein
MSGQVYASVFYCWDRDWNLLVKIRVDYRAVLAMEMRKISVPTKN